MLRSRLWPTQPFTDWTVPAQLTGKNIKAARRDLYKARLVEYPDFWEILEKEIPVKQKPVSLPVQESQNEIPVSNLTSDDPQAGDSDISQEEANSKVDELVKLYNNAISDKWKG